VNEGGRCAPVCVERVRERGVERQRAVTQRYDLHYCAEHDTSDQGDFVGRDYGPIALVLMMIAIKETSWAGITARLP
jgi:hypothetical protein